MCSSDLKDDELLGIVLYIMNKRFVKNIFHGVVEAGFSDIPFNVGNVSSGIYFLKIKHKDSEEIIKIIKI